MFWIVGAEKIADALTQLNFPGAYLVSAQLNHSAWNGFTFYDLIYPMFIYVVGISVTLSIRSRIERGEPLLKILRHIFTRTVLLFLVGFYMSNSGLGFNWHSWLTNPRWPGVLQRIAICYCITAILVLFLKPRYQVIFSLVFLVGYWGLLQFVPVPGFGAGVFNIPEANLANYIDKIYLPGRLYYKTWDPEGLLSTFPAIVTCQLGAYTGFWLKTETGFKKRPVTLGEKNIWLAIIGLAALGVGILWGFYFPINKKIWTSSYVLVTGGLSAIIMALFYWIIDLKGYKKWTFPFVVIGLNSIFIYVAFSLLPLDSWARWMIGKELLNWLGATQQLIIALLTFIIGWLALYIMYKRKIFLRF